MAELKKGGKIQMNESKRKGDSGLLSALTAEYQRSQTQVQNRALHLSLRAASRNPYFPVHGCSPSAITYQKQYCTVFEKQFSHVILVSDTE